MSNYKLFSALGNTFDKLLWFTIRSSEGAKDGGDEGSRSLVLAYWLARRPRLAHLRSLRLSTPFHS